MVNLTSGSPRETLAQIVRQLEDSGGCSKTSNGWQGRCPSHEDNTASLSVANIGDDGKVLLRCHAGCKTENIVAKFGFKMRDLSPSVGRKQIHDVKAYNYEDVDGKLLFQVVRTVRRAGKKFYQRRQKADGGWVNNLKGVTKVPYRLPKIVAAGSSETIFIVEGEKDVDLLESHGMVATCNPGGANKWLKDYNKWLNDRYVVIIPDNDRPGQNHATDIATKLQGIAATVKVIELPDLPLKGDASDWFSNSGSRTKLEELMADTDEWTRPTEAEKPTFRLAGADGQDATVNRDDLWSPAFQTEVSNGKRFIKEHGETVRWCEEWKCWLHWDGKRWNPDSDGNVYALAKSVGNNLWKRLEEEVLPDNLEKQLKSFFKATESKSGICNFLDLAKSECGIPVKPDLFDTNPMVLNVGNGTLDLTTGTLNPHDREDRLTKLADVDFDRSATAPRWLQFLDEIFEEDKELLEFIQRAVGYSMTGHTSERCLFFLHGGGANGKTTFVTVIQKLLGDYATGITADLLMTSKPGSIPAEILDLRGARMAVANETESGRRFAESDVKNLTGGEDKRKGRRLYQQFEEYEPTDTLWLSGNHKPRISGTDDGIWDRLKLIPFTRRFEDTNTDTPVKHRIDRGLAKTLAGELPGILNWALAGCLSWQKKGLPSPAKVRDAVAEYRHDEDVVGSFIEECCDVHEGNNCLSSSLYQAFQLWSNAAGDKRPMNKQRFGYELTAKYYTRDKIGGRAYRRGLDLKSGQAGQEQDKNS